MKKLLLSCALAFAALFANGQALSRIWYYDAVASDGLVLNSGSVHNSVAYNKTNGNLYVAHRGTAIYIVDPADFNAVAGTLNSTAFSTSLSTKRLKQPATLDAAHSSKVRVDDNGVIYSVAMSTSGKILVYRWDDENATPIRHEFTATFTVGAETKHITRVGDSFAIYGTGDDTYLYVGNSNSNANPVTDWTSGQYLTVLKVTNKIPAIVNIFDLKTAKHGSTSNFMDVGNRSISAQSSNVLWMNNFQSGVMPRKITLDLNAGTMTDYSVVNLSSSNFAATYYIKDGTEEYLASAGAASTGSTSQFQNIQLSKIGAENTVAKTVATTALSSVSFGKSTTLVANTGFSDIAHVRNADNTTTFFFLSANNGLGAFKTSVPLPVSLTSFDAALVKGQSTLTWETASETNNKGFEVLRSTDGKDFTKIGFVDSKGQNGNSVTALNYSYTDRTAKAGVNYYQLNQIDLDGKNELFKDVKSVNLSLNGADVVVFPNPATTYVTVSAGSADFKGVKYELFDASGKKVLSEKATAEQQDISLSKLPASIYFLKISKDNVVQRTVKLVKQ